MPLAGSDRGARSNAHFRHAERHMRDPGRCASFGKAMAHFERAMAYGAPIPSNIEIEKGARLSNGGPYAFEWTYDYRLRTSQARISVKRGSDPVAHITLDLVQQTGGDWIFVSSVNWDHDMRDVQKRYIARAVASLVLFVQYTTGRIITGNEKRIDATFDETWVLSPLDTTSAWEITEPKKKSLLRASLQRLGSNENKENEGGNIGRAVLDTSVATVTGMLDRLLTLKNTGYNRLDDTQSNRPTPGKYYTNGGLVYGVSETNSATDSGKDKTLVHVTVIEPTGKSKDDHTTVTVVIDVSTNHKNQGKLFVSDKSFTFKERAEGSTKAYIRLAVASLLSHLHPGLVDKTDAADARAQWKHQPYTNDSEPALLPLHQRLR
jgi:hypothetical protein